MLSLDEWMNLLDQLDFFDEDFNRREVRQETRERGGGEGGGREKWRGRRGGVCVWCITLDLAPSH